MKFSAALRSEKPENSDGYYPAGPGKTKGSIVLKNLINEDNVRRIIRSNMRNATDEQVQHLTQRILANALPAVCMLVRLEIIEERESMLKGQNQ